MVVFNFEGTNAARFALKTTSAFNEVTKKEIIARKREETRENTNENDRLLGKNISNIF